MNILIKDSDKTKQTNKQQQQQQQQQQKPAVLTTLHTTLFSLYYLQCFFLGITHRGTVGWDGAPEDTPLSPVWHHNWSLF